jgi:hypothetical protein
MGSLYGFEVESDLPLRRLNAARGTRGRLSVAIAELPAPAGEPVSTLVNDDGHCWYASYELDGGSCLLELPPTGSFLLEPELLRIGVERRDADDELLEHRIASAAICTLLAIRGDLVLHAAAAEVEGRAVVLCGPTQRGKSTLVQTLGSLGHGVLGEDGIDIADPQDPVVHPGARGIRMRTGGDRRAPTLAPDPGPVEPASAPLSAFVLLGPRGAELEVEPLAPADALALLTPNLVHSGSRAAIGASFSSLAQLLHSVPAYRASLPDHLDRLADSASRLLDRVVVRS